MGRTGMSSTGNDMTAEAPDGGSAGGVVASSGGPRPEAGARPAARVGASVGHGMSWMTVSTLGIKFLAFISQIVLGWLLLKEDFGIYATALAVAGVVTSFRDGGVRELLIQKGHSAYEDLVGPVFWLALAVNVAAAGVLAGGSPVVARVYGEPRLVWMLLIIACTLPMGTTGAILQARMRMDMRFGAISRIMMVSALIKNAGTIGLAAAGLGPYSFVLPLIPATIFENVASYAAVRARPWRYGAQVARWGGLISRTRWLVFGAVANVLFDMGPYAVLGAIVPDAVVGTYFFAAQITAQIGVLLSANVQQVLFPALASMEGDRARMAAASMRTLRALMLIGGYACLCLSAVMGPLEMFLWHGKWAAATPAVQILGFFFPLRITFGLCAALMLAEGRFKGLCFLTLYEGLAIIAAAVIGGLSGGTATTIAWWTGGAMALGRLAGTMYTMHSVGVGPRRVLRAILPPWMLATGAALLAVGIDAYGGLGPAVRPMLSQVGLRGGVLEMGVNGLRVAVMGTVCTAAFAIGARVLIPTRLREAIAVGPRRIGAKVERVLLLKAP